MEIKTNYFLRNMVDLEITTLSEYLKGAKFNFVILEKNVPIVWGSDKTPVIYGGFEDVEAELVELKAYADEEETTLKPEFKVITEAKFIKDFCLDAIAEYLFEKVVKLKNFDGVNYILHFDNTFNGIINLNGMTDILNVYADMVNKNVNFLISDDDDIKQDFCYLGDFPYNVIVKIVNYVENIISPKEFITDLYDLLVRNTQYVTEEEFYNKYIKDDETITLDTTENGEYYKMEFENFNLVVIPK